MKENVTATGFSSTCSLLVTRKMKKRKDNSTGFFKPIVTLSLGKSSFSEYRLGIRNHIIIVLYNIKHLVNCSLVCFPRLSDSFSYCLLSRLYWLWQVCLLLWRGLLDLSNWNQSHVFLFYDINSHMLFKPLTSST